MPRRESLESLTADDLGHFIKSRPTVAATCLFQRPKATVQLLKMLRIELSQQRPDRLVDFGHAENLSIAQRCRNLCLCNLHTRFGLFTRYFDARLQDHGGNAGRPSISSTITFEAS